MSSDQQTREKCPVAVVGIGCRMPGGVTTPQEFWDVLVNGRDMITEIPPDRWSIESFHDPDQSNLSKMVTKRCGFIHDIDKFDNTFFKISPREAASMDPQQRHILEVTYEAFQDAGIIPEILGESCGVYIGVGTMDYHIMLMDTSLTNPYSHTGSVHSVVANRISYVFNLRGPSIAVDTACASSVTALHMACSAIWDGECTSAVAGGCQSNILPEVMVGFTGLGVLSPEGKCCPFSDTATGYVRSEGWGTFILKRLDDALVNKDHIYAVIRGSAIGASGFSKSLTMPSAEAQEIVMRNVYNRFNIPMSSVQYVEAHGTGTPVGDPIEASAIGAVFGPGRESPIKIGSVKGNFGHNECAAGITAAIKVALMLKKKELVPTINFHELNPKINKDVLNIQVQRDIEEIQDDGSPFTVGLNSFGFAGSVAHMVFQEAPKYDVAPKVKSGWSFGKESHIKGKSIVVPLSAKTPEALTDLTAKWESFECDKDALSVAAWQATRRDHLPYRMTVVANSGANFRDATLAFTQDIGSESVVAGRANPNKPKICFVFPGQGQQWIDMGRKLFEDEQVFHDSVVECDELFKELSGWSVLKSCGLFGSRDITEATSPFTSAEDALQSVEVIQPAILFIQVGMCRLWRHWGVEPDVVVGHSLGEVAGAYACGGLTLPEAIAVIYHRSHEQAKLTGTGCMAALRATVEQAKAICQKHQNVYIAAINGPGAITLAGDSDEIAAIVDINPGKAKKLRVTCAFHTPEMDPIEESFNQAMQGIIASETVTRQVHFYSTVSRHYHQEALDADYWWNNIRKTVLFQPAVNELLQDSNIDVFLEVSASATLLSCVKQIVRSVDPQRSISTVNSSLRDKDDLHSIQRAIGSLYAAGVDLHWDNITKKAAEWAPIPTYQWQHQSFWLETEERREKRLGLDDRSFKGQNGKITLTNFPYLADHVVNDRIVFSGAGYVEFITEMSFKDDEAPCMKDVNFTRVLTWPEDGDKKGVLHLDIHKEGDHVQVKCDNNSHCNAIIDTKTDATSNEVILSVVKIIERCDKKVTKEEMNAWMQRVGFANGPASQMVDRAFFGDGESIAYLSPISDSNQRISIPHLDASFQLPMASIGSITTMYIPVHIDTLKMTKPSLPTGQSIIVYTNIIDCDSTMLIADITMATESGNILAEVSGIRAQNVYGNQSDIDIGTCIYTTQWQPIAACSLPPSVIKEVLEESHLTSTYEEEMDAIHRAEEVLDDIEAICTSYIRNAIETVPEEERCKGQSYEKYISRFKTIASSTSVKDIPYDSIPQIMERVQKHCPELDTEISLTKSLGEALPATFRDPQVAVPIMFSPEGLDRYFYDSLSTRVHYKAAAEVINKAVVEGLTQKRVVRILELGARIGGLTRFVVEPLKELGFSNQIEYVFTDVRATLFKQGQENLSMYPFIQYKQIDIEKDVADQGFVPGSYDIVVCLDTLHAAADVKRSSDYMANLLTPDGLMFIIEGMNTHFLTELWFGALNESSVFDDFRKERCWKDRQSWVDIMRSIGLHDVTSASTPRAFFHSVVVGRKNEEENRNEKYQRRENNWITETADSTKLMIIQEINNKLEDEIEAAYKGDIDIKSFSEATEFASLFHEHTSSPMKVMYIHSDADSNLHALLKLLQAVELYPQSVKCVWVLTKGGNKECTFPNASLAIGLTRAVNNQVPNVPIYSVDFDTTCNVKENFQALMAMMKEPNVPEREIVIRKKVRCVPRILHQELETNRTVSTSWRVEQVISQKGSRSIDDLAFHDITSQKTSPGHVKICVRAAPLKYKDIKMSMGLLEGLESEPRPSFGIECSGIIEEVGVGVKNVKVGDEVIAFGKKCFASHVICDAKLTAPKPKGLDWTESAPIGVVFVTAYMSLVERAHLQPDETILIHSACGGVGLAAIQIARMLGAKITCTAGTEEKRQYLRDVIGVEMVSDSRSTKFYDDVMSFTQGRGVDVVLNSLSGKLLATSMSVLAPCGRFCEIGKRDILHNSNLSLNALLENKSFISCQVDILMRQSPDTVQRLMQKVVNLFETNTLSPIPTSVYPMEKLTDAFRYMAKGSHIGQIVFDISDDFQPEELKPPVQQFSATATYIVTGGYGGIGQSLSRWLCDNGARHIVLVSRNGARTAAARRMVRYLQTNGVKVSKYQIDVADEKGVRHMLDSLRDDSTVPPIKGIFHLAGVIEEEKLSEITHEQVNRILDAKVSGAHHLHTLTKEDDLAIFFLLSSISGVWGNPAQPIYCAANNYLDGLAEKRHSQGLPALSIQLAPVKGAGYLADKDDEVKIMVMKGNLQIHVDEFLKVLGRLLQQRDLPVVCLANQDWGSTQQFCHKSMLKFHHLTTSSKATDKADGAIGKEDMENWIKSKMADLLDMPVHAIDVTQPMINYGVDSLVAMEMVNWVTNQLGVSISQLDILGGITTAALLQTAIDS
ncbi:probable polyketide synthase 1 [Amphiura filiformis]|uniref:probable polyketide synthase 1 n=1 Tax=Amphiura filiformis TaxID=82378 RepID=UPI003B213A0B